MRKFAVPVMAVAFTMAGFTFASAQTGNPNTSQTPKTTPPSVQNAQQDSINRIRQQESAQDKSAIRQEQRGKPDTGRAVVDPTIRDNTTLDNLAPDDAKRQAEQQRVNASQPATPSTTAPDQKANRANSAQQPQGATVQQQRTMTTTKDGGVRTQTQTKDQTVTTPSGTTITQSQTKTHAHQPGQAPDRTMITKRTVTTADGKTIEREYYNDMEVLQDENGRRYYMEHNNRIYFGETDNSTVPTNTTTPK